jgi:3-(3-hydroxy-phenyl)propionate hydroxylase
MATRTHWPVIVVGAGPTGLTLACLLARYRIDVLVIERNAHTVQEPRAVSIDDESLRTMQAVGIINELVPRLVLGYGSEYLSPSGRRFLKVKPATLEYGYPRRNAFRQPVLERLLRDHLARFDNAAAWFEAELLDFSPSPEEVAVKICRGGQTAALSCAYLVGCDGSRSLVRQKLGIEMRGSTFQERWLVLDLEQTTDATRDTKVYCNPARPGLSLPGPDGTRRFEFMLHDGEDDAAALAPDHVAALLRQHGNDDRAVLKRKVVYTFHARMAERWRDGRVLLAGDAAHLMPPFAGQGMNSGVRDAHNLAWKLAAVVSRQLGPGLLDTYEAERRDHAAAMTQLAIRMGRVMMPRSRLQAFAVRTFFRALALHPAARSYFAEMKYKPKPRFRRGFLLDPPTDGNAASGKQMLVGKLFPQALVMTASGFVLSDEVFGDGFALVAPPGTPPRVLQEVRIEESGGLPIRAVAVLDKEDASAVAAPVVAARDLRGELAELLSPYPSGLYLLRPDRYVAGFFPLSAISSAAAAIAKLVAATWTYRSATTSGSAARRDERA